MNLISSLQHVLGFRSSAAATGVRREAAGKPLAHPVGQRREDVQLWKSQLKQADTLRSSLVTASGSSLSPKTMYLGLSAAPDVPLRGSTRVTLLDHATKEDTDRLHASWLSKNTLKSGGSMLMASPRVQDSRAWAAACAEHRIAVVVDLGTVEEAQTLNHCMRSTAPAVFKDCAVAFISTDATGTGFPMEERMTGLGEGAVSRRVKAVMRSHVEGAQGRREAVPAEVAVSAAQPASVSHDMTWLRIPSSREASIGPRVLLDACRHLRSLGLEDKQSVAFMSPGGDRRSAVYGAAWDIQCKIDAGGVHAWTLPALVEGVCARVRAHRHPSALDAKEDIASLLAFATLALEDRAGKAGRRA